MAASVVFGVVLTQWKTDASLIKGRPLGHVSAGGTEETPSRESSYTPPGPLACCSHLDEQDSDVAARWLWPLPKPAVWRLALKWLLSLSYSVHCRGILSGKPQHVLGSDHLGGHDGLSLSWPPPSRASWALPFPAEVASLVGWWHVT